MVIFFYGWLSRIKVFWACMLGYIRVTVHALMVKCLSCYKKKQFTSLANWCTLSKTPVCTFLKLSFLIYSYAYAWNAAVLIVFTII